MSTKVTQIESIQGAGDDALEQLTSILAQAFTYDPGMQFICQHERDGYPNRLRNWFRATLRLYRANAQPLLVIRAAANGYVACAVLTLPDAQLKPATVLRWIWDVTQHAGLRSLWRTMTHIQRISTHQPNTPHYRLEFVAVHPAHQGQGYGRMLLDETHRLAEADERAAGVWLETADPALVPLYERFSYRVEHRLQMTAEVQVMLMFRANA